MVVLTADRNTPKMVGGVDLTVNLPISAGQIIFQGALCAIDTADGEITEGVVSTTLVSLGRAKTAVDNTADGLSVEVEQGIFRWANSGGDAVPAAQAGADCFIEDDQTVSAANGGATRSRAGIVVLVDADGVWVQMGLGL